MKKPPPKPLPDLKFLNECFRLDEQAGQLFWRERPRHHFTTERCYVQYNYTFPGRRADGKCTLNYRRVRICIDGRQVFFAAHRIIWKMVNGRDPVPTVDHIDRDPSNNTPKNLREATFSMQMRNRNPKTGNRSRRTKQAS